MPEVALISAALFAIRTSSGSYINEQMSLWLILNLLWKMSRFLVCDDAKRRNVIKHMPCCIYINRDEPSSGTRAPEFHFETGVNLFIYRVVVWVRTDRQTDTQTRPNWSKQDEMPAGGESVYTTTHLDPQFPLMKAKHGPDPLWKAAFDTEQHIAHLARDSLVHTLSSAFLFIHRTAYKMLVRLNERKPFE